jgi:hypothetical protein
MYNRGDMRFDLESLEIASRVLGNITAAGDLQFVTVQEKIAETLLAQIMIMKNGGAVPAKGAPVVEPVKIPDGIWVLQEDEESPNRKGWGVVPDDMYKSLKERLLEIPDSYKPDGIRSPFSYGLDEGTFA